MFFAYFPIFKYNTPELIDYSFGGLVDLFLIVVAVWFINQVEHQFLPGVGLGQGVFMGGGWFKNAFAFFGSNHELFQKCKKIVVPFQFAFQGVVFKIVEKGAEVIGLDEGAKTFPGFLHLFSGEYSFFAAQYAVNFFQIGSVLSQCSDGYMLCGRKIAGGAVK